VVPGGGISPDGVRWIGCETIVLSPGEGFERPLSESVPDLSAQCMSGRQIEFHGEMAGLAQPAAFEALCRQARRIRWVVFVKPPFGGQSRS
jgi:hypothetical protein